MNRREILNKIKTGITSVDPDAEIYLYGSRARGDNRIDSDWDILVVTPKQKITYEYRFKLRDPIYSLELESGQLISLFVYSKSDWDTKQKISPFYHNVKQEGIQL